MKKFLCGLAIFILTLSFIPVQANTKNADSNFLDKTFLISSPKPINNLVGNYNNEVKIVFSDIDRTVIVVSDKDSSILPSPKLISAVKKLKKQNIPLIFVTGRSYDETSEIIQKIGSDNAYVITQQGAEIFNSKGQLVFQSSIKYPDAIKILDEAENYMKRTKIDSKVLVFANGKSYAKSDFKIPSKWKTPVVIKSYADLDKDTMIAKILIYEANPEKIQLVQDDLKKKFPEFNIVLGSPYFCEINAPLVNKGNSIKKISEILGFDLKNAGVFGDSENDLSMFKQVRQSGGLTVVVGNAIDILKQNADYMTSTVDNDGFANAVDKILENNAVLQSRKK